MNKRLLEHWLHFELHFWEVKPKGNPLFFQWKPTLPSYIKINCKSTDCTLPKICKGTSTSPRFHTLPNSQETISKSLLPLKVNSIWSVADIHELRFLFRQVSSVTLYFTRVHILEHLSAYLLCPFTGSDLSSACQNPWNNKICERTFTLHLFRISEDDYLIQLWRIR